MKDTLYNIIINGLSAVCLIIISITFLYVGCQTHRMNEDLEHWNRYHDLKQQYDTTTQYNRLVLYHKMVAASDSI